MNPTPRTDEQHAKWRIADDPYGAMTEHARQLERELMALEKRFNALDKAYTEVWRAAQPMNNPEVKHER